MNWKERNTSVVICGQYDKLHRNLNKVLELKRGLLDGGNTKFKKSITLSLQHKNHLEYI